MSEYNYNYGADEFTVGWIIGTLGTLFACIIAGVITYKLIN